MRQANAQSFAPTQWHEVCLTIPGFGQIVTNYKHEWEQIIMTVDVRAIKQEAEETFRKWLHAQHARE